MAAKGKPFHRYFDSDFTSDETKERPAASFKRSHSMHTKSKPFNEKRKVKLEKTPEEKKKLALLKKEHGQKKKEKKRRLIIRNLSFMLDEEELKGIFSKFGNVVEVTIPKNPDGKKKGFAFIQFEKFHSSLQAIKNLNYKKLHGRPIAIDYAIAKSKYEHIMSSRKVTEDSSVMESDEIKVDEASESDASENEETEREIPVEPSTEVKKTKKISDQSDKVSNFLKELNFTADSDDDDDDDDNKDLSSDEDESESADDEERSDGDENEDAKSDSKDAKTVKPRSEVKVAGDETVVNNPKLKRTQNDDTQEGRTVFVRNISFDSAEEDFREAMAEFGTLKYCLFCIDPVTEHPKGTAFVKFENKEDADKLIEKSSDDNYSEGLYLDGRRLYCSVALSREEIKNRTGKDGKQNKDKRNLRLLKEGLIMPNSEEAEGVSQADLSKRMKLEMMKKQKLKNLNFFVSDTRLSVHNLPNDYTDQQLRKLFREVVGRSAFITEARVMKDLRKVNEKGDTKSKGFGFVAFSKHEDALLALQKINNSPTVFTAQKRPIVEFSVENHLALLSKQRRRERNKLRNKRKHETSTEPPAELSNNGFNAESPCRSSEKNKIKKKKPMNKQHQLQSGERKKPRKQNKGHQRNKKPKKGTIKDERVFKKLVDQYKDKLLNKLK